MEENKTLEDRIVEFWIIDNIERDGDGNIIQMNLRDEGTGIIASLTYPSSSNNNYIIRAAFEKEFNTWEDAPYEKVFKNENEVKIDPSVLYDILIGGEDWAQNS